MRLLVPLLLTGAVVGGVLLLSRSAAPAPAPAPTPSGPLPPVLQQAFDDLMAKAQHDPASVDPGAMDALGDQLTAAGFPDQAAQIHAAADAVKRAHELPPIPNPNQAPGFGLPGGGVTFTPTPFTPTTPAFVPIQRIPPGGFAHPPFVPPHRGPGPTTFTPTPAGAASIHRIPAAKPAPTAPTFENPQGLTPSELLRRMGLPPFGFGR